MMADIVLIKVSQLRPAGTFTLPPSALTCDIRSLGWWWMVSTMLTGTGSSRCPSSGTSLSRSVTRVIQSVPGCTLKSAVRILC